jgi:hypothetical protein
MIMAGGHSNEVGLATGNASFRYPWVASFSINKANGVAAFA